MGKYIRMGQRCSPGTCLCVGPLSGSGWENTTWQISRPPYRERFKRRTGLNCTQSSTSLGTSLGISTLWRIAWELSTRPTESTTGAKPQSRASMLTNGSDEKQRPRKTFRPQCLSGGPHRTSPETHAKSPKLTALGTTGLMPSLMRRRKEPALRLDKGSNRQKLCTYVQKAQEQILAQIQVLEAQPGDARNRRQQNLAGHA
eukprot:12038775-Heterocapsa_arctica.AAC.1